MDLVYGGGQLCADHGLYRGYGVWERPLGADFGISRVDPVDIAIVHWWVNVVNVQLLAVDDVR